MARSTLITAVVALIAGFAGAALWSMSGFGHNYTRAYLLENPQLLPQMAENYQRQQGEERLASVTDEVTTPFPGAVLGNPQGSITLVEFTDYGCSFCRASVPHIEQLIAQNPELRVVVREWPIFQGSDVAARMALAAAKQGKYTAFHNAMFERGPPSAAGTEAAARAAGLDMGKALSFTGSQEADRELAQNMGLAQQLGFTGTPSWVIGGRLLEGAIGPEALQEAIDAAGS